MTLPWPFSTLQLTRSYLLAVRGLPRPGVLVCIRARPMVALSARCQAASNASVHRSGNGHVQTPGKAPVVLPKPRRDMLEAPGRTEEARPAPGSLGVVDESHRRQFGPIKVRIVQGSPSPQVQSLSCIS